MVPFIKEMVLFIKEMVLFIKTNGSFVKMGKENHYVPRYLKSSRLNLTLSMADIIENGGRQILSIWKWGYRSKRLGNPDIENNLWFVADLLLGLFL